MAVLLPTVLSVRECKYLARFSRCISSAGSIRRPYPDMPVATETLIVVSKKSTS